MFLTFISFKEKCILGGWSGQYLNKKGDGVYNDCKMMSDGGILYTVDCPPPSFAEFQCHLEGQTKAMKDGYCSIHAYHHICRKRKRFSLTHFTNLFFTTVLITFVLTRPSVYYEIAVI